MISPELHVKALEDNGHNFWNIKRVFLSYPSQFSLNNPEIFFDITNKVSTKFNIPLSSIRACGSAHTGYSFIKKREFLKKESDLDLAIIDARFFQETLEKCYERSDGFRPDLFPKDRKTGQSTRNQFISYSGRGIIRPDLMPTGPERQEMWSFFNKISSDYSEEFKSISVGIYISERIYTLKQRNSLISSELEVL